MTTPHRRVTPRALEALDHMCDAKTPAETAATMGLSLATVRMYLMTLRAAYGVPSSAQLVALRWAERAGQRPAMTAGTGVDS
jgi:DNA-binding CsgD family transcriptional regulator